MPIDNPNDLPLWDPLEALAGGPKILALELKSTIDGNVLQMRRSEDRSTPGQTAVQFAVDTAAWGAGKFGTYVPRVVEEPTRNPLYPLRVTDLGKGNIVEVGAALKEVVGELGLYAAIPAQNRLNVDSYEERHKVPLVAGVILETSRPKLLGVLDSRRVSHEGKNRYQYRLDPLDGLRACGQTYGVQLAASLLTPPKKSWFRRG